jgi:hypothetical protein
MDNAAIQMARNIAALIPAKPPTKLLGGEASRQEQLAYGAAMAGSVGAWRFAAHAALNNAMSCAPDDWQIDYDNHAFIDGVSSLADLEAMCDQSYPWSGRRLDQI